MRLVQYGFRDSVRAQANLEALRANPVLGARLGELLETAARAADPDQALNLLERLVAAGAGDAGLRAALGRLGGLERGVFLLGASAFVAEAVVREPDLLAWLLSPGILDRARHRHELVAEAARGLASAPTAVERLERLRAFKRREILHIAARDLLHIATVPQTLQSLTVLAEVVIEQAYEVCLEALFDRYGARHARPARSGFVVLGLGKLGAGELNFSSDVDLVYVYGRDREPAGLRGGLPLAASELYDRLGRDLTTALSESIGEGQLYRVDLRLRPEGRFGALVHSVASAERYYQLRAATWERVALIRARVVAGDRAVGRRFLGSARRFVYGGPLDQRALRELLRLKLRLERQVDLKGRLQGNVKLGTGGIREVEMVVQTLQLRFGASLPAVRGRGLPAALRALARHGRLPREEADGLLQAYLYLRDVENKLQMARGLQTHVLPDEPRELRALARRMGYLDQGPRSAEQLFRADFKMHTARVRRAYRRSFGPGGPFGSTG
jgi:glutamate-ammonia-ligase adenylyltransferase